MFCVRHTAVQVSAVAELTLCREMIQFSWQFQYVLYVGHSTSFPIIVNVILISVLDMGFSLRRLVSPCESALAAGQCFANIQNSSDLVCVPYHTPLHTAVGSKFEMDTYLFPECTVEAAVCIFPFIFCISGTQPTQCEVKEALL